MVVQRACAEAEAGQPEVSLLTALLQTQSALSRREMFQRHFVPAPPPVQAGFVKLVTDTQLELEKKVLKGESVDPSLLQALRVIAVEANEYDPPAVADVDI